MCCVTRGGREGGEVRVGEGREGGGGEGGRVGEDGEGRDDCYTYSKQTTIFK